MKLMKVLTCNGNPLYCSKDEKTLEKTMDLLIMKTKASEDLEILSVKRGEITYHNGISYCTDKYEITDVKEI